MLSKIAAKRLRDDRRRLEAEQTLAANLDYVFQCDVEYHRELTKDYLAACAFKLECIQVVEKARRLKEAFERGEAGGPQSTSGAAWKLRGARGEERRQ
jgi:hypothetical protein